MYKLKVTSNVQSSKVQQIVTAIRMDIDRGTLKRGERLPSINEFSDKNNVARDTIEKAYKQLRATGYIASYPSRGYFVLGRNTKQLQVLLIFDKLSSFKKIVYDGVLDGMGKKAKVDLQIHHYDPRLLREILEANLGKYDYYVVMPHFFSSAREAECLSVLKLVPPHQLLLLDKILPQFQLPCKAVYQDFGSDIYNALLSSVSLIRKYESITLILPEDIHHPKEIIEGIQAFCKQQKIKYHLREHIGEKALRKKTIYIVTEEDDLAQLIKAVRQAGWVQGSDVGIISFNETVFKELLDITVFTTDFYQMGKTAAKLILNKELAQYKNPFTVIHRGSL